MAMTVKELREIVNNQEIPEETKVAIYYRRPDDQEFFDVIDFEYDAELYDGVFHLNI